ncbi:hypothetical protein BDY21DRAFT_349970 [Lineolata rhizophorae]|uniref:Uncharacterized protein n=1 Tax=Lineolata rhizophorae TaxID=578093 RepID=A0A6A6NVA4_9PEZI|nr:hypothetical protein BDY21DRAFT_349970 [Lineolata rhizophorae]
MANDVFLWVGTLLFTTFICLVAVKADGFPFPLLFGERELAIPLSQGCLQSELLCLSSLYLQTAWAPSTREVERFIRRLALNATNKANVLHIPERKVARNWDYFRPSHSERCCPESDCA